MQASSLEFWEAESREKEGGGGAKAEGQWGHQEETAAVGLVELARLKRGVCVCVCLWVCVNISNVQNARPTELQGD